jgi:hypothetical protein
MISNININKINLIEILVIKHFTEAKKKKKIQNKSLVP